MKAILLTGILLAATPVSDNWQTLTIQAIGALMALVATAYTRVEL